MWPIWASNYRTSLQMYQERHPTAEDQGKEECCRSGTCCWRRPGNLNREDVTRIASHFGITEQELFKQFLIVDDVMADPFALLPRRDHQQGGEMISTEETYSFRTPCVFLDTKNDNACKIHEVKPIGCREYRCWDRSDEHSNYDWTKEQLMQLGWDGIEP